jgi:hypothetical protein
MKRYLLAAFAAFATYSTSANAYYTWDCEEISTQEYNEATDGKASKIRSSTTVENGTLKNDHIESSTVGDDGSTYVATVDNSALTGTYRCGHYGDDTGELIDEEPIVAPPFEDVFELTHLTGDGEWYRRNAFRDLPFAAGSAVADLREVRINQAWSKFQVLPQTDNPLCAVFEAIFLNPPPCLEHIATDVFGQGPHVVIAGPPSSNGADPGVVRLRNVGSGEYEIRFQEWDYLNGHHTYEDVPVLLLRPGRFSMADGTVLEVGTFDQQGAPNWTRHNFGAAFGQTPHLFLTIQTSNGNETLTVRARNVTATGFEAGLFEQESFMNSAHDTETIGYLAVYSPQGSGTLPVDSTVEPFVLQQSQVRHLWTPVLGRRLKLEEERSKDTELRHTPETIDVLTIGTYLFGQDVTSNGMDTAVLRARY